jgi:hypothetical protein
MSVGALISPSTARCKNHDRLLPPGSGAQRPEHDRDGTAAARRVGVPRLGIHQVADDGPARPLRSVVAVIAAGIAMMGMARFVLRSSFFGLRRESAR